MRAEDITGVEVIDGPRAVPALPQDRKTIEPVIREPLEKMRLALETLRGLHGDPLDQAITFRQARHIGLINTLGDLEAGGTGTPGPQGPAGPTGATGGTVTPDLTPPPSVTGLAAIAGLANIIVTWDAPTYSVGHGHRATNLYAVKKLASDPTLPTFADAVLFEEETGGLTISALPSDLGIRWHLWAKFVTNDGVESTSPAGGVNGVSAQTGKIGNNDLGPLIITADKIAAGGFAGMNLVPNGGAEQGTICWRLSTPSTSAGATLTADTAEKTGGQQSFKVTKLYVADQVAVLSNAFPVIPGETYSVKVKVKGSAATTSGLYIQMFPKNIKPTGDYVSEGGPDGYVGGTVTLLANGAVPNSWATFEGTYTPPAGMYWVSVGVLPWISAPVTMWFDDVEVGRQITASYLAAGSIAVGSAAIADAAIRRALIENLAVDDAKVANLSAAKLTIGDGTVGGNLKSTLFSSGSAGWILRPDGSAEFGFAHIRGTLLAAQVSAGLITASKINVTDLSAISANLGAITAGSIHGGYFHSGGFGNGYAWPPAGQNGFHLSPSGLLIGNYNDGRYFQVNANGDIYAPGLTIAGGSAAFSGNLSAAGGTFSGTLSAAALTIAGAAIIAPAFASAGSSLTFGIDRPENVWTSLGVVTGSVDPGPTGQVMIAMQVDFITSAGEGASGGGDA